MAGNVNNPIQSYQEATNQLLAINAQRRSNAAEARAEELSETARNSTLAQAAEFVSSQTPQETTSASFNPATQNILKQYGLGQPRIQKNSASSQQVTKQNITINNKNTNITNNNVQVPANVGGPVQGRPIQFQDPGQIKFKTWINNAFAQQNEMAEKRKREYEKRDSGLERSSSKLMKKLEDTSKNVASSMNPKYMASSMGNQLKTLFRLFGLAYIAKNWPKILDKVTNIENKVVGFFTDEGGTLTKMLGGKNNEKPFEALKNLFIDKDNGIFTYLKTLLGNFLKERSLALSKVPKPDFQVERGLGIDGNLSKILSNLATYLGNVLQTIVNPEAGLRTAMETNIKNENNQNINNYYYENHKKFDSGKTTLEDGNGNLYVDAKGNHSFKYEDTAGGIFKKDGFKGVLPGSFDKRTGNLISDTQEIQGEISQGMDVARNIKEASREGGSINTSDVAAGLSRLNIKAHESGHVYLDRDSIESLGVTPEEIHAEKITGRYIVVPRSEDLKNLDYQATLKERDIYNSNIQAGYKALTSDEYTGGLFTNLVKKQFAPDGEDYHTVLIDDKDLEIVKNYLKAEGKPFKVLEKTQEDIYKLSEEQMRFITQNMGINLGEYKNIASDMSLSNKEYLDAVNKFLESKSDYDYYNSPEYKEYEKQKEVANSLHPEKVIEDATKRAIDQLISSRKLPAGSNEALKLYKKPLHELLFELLKQHEDLTKRIQSRDLKDGEELADLYREDEKIQELINEIKEYYTVVDEKGNEVISVNWGKDLSKALLDPNRNNVITIDGKDIGNLQLKNTFQKLEPVEPPKPAVRKSNYQKFSEGLDEYHTLVEQNNQVESQIWNNNRMHNAAQNISQYANNVGNNARAWLANTGVANFKITSNPSNINSGDISGVIEASKKGVFYSNSSDSNIEGGSGPMSKHGHGYISLGKDLHGFMHKCTSGPATFYHDGTSNHINLNGRWWDTGSPKTATGTRIGEVGFKHVWSGTREEGYNTASIEKTGFRLLPGDIMLNFGTGKSGASSHAQMWNGEQWVSDTYQKDRSFVYGSGRLGKESAQIWRYDAMNDTSQYADAKKSDSITEQTGLLTAEDFEDNTTSTVTPEGNNDIAATQETPAVSATSSSLTSNTYVTPLPEVNSNSETKSKSNDGKTDRSFYSSTLPFVNNSYSNKATNVTYTQESAAQENKTGYTSVQKATNFTDTKKEKPKTVDYTVSLSNIDSDLSLLSKISGAMAGELEDIKKGVGTLSAQVGNSKQSTPKPVAQSLTQPNANT